MQGDLFNEKVFTELERSVKLPFKDKIKKAIAIIKKGEQMALKMNNEGYHVSFSGGKDSIVLYDIFKKANVIGQAYFYNTQLEISEIPIFLRKNYPEIKFLYPEKTFYKLIEENTLLPTRRNRFCCKYLKECHGYNAVTLTGITIFESARRKKQNKDFLKHICGGKKGEKIMLSPILHFTEKDIYKYIKENNLILPNFYSHKKRGGCIGCPMSNKRIQDLKENPKILKAILKALNKNFYTKKRKFKNADEMIDWWLSDKSIKSFLSQTKQVNMFDE